MVRSTSLPQLPTDPAVLVRLTPADYLTIARLAQVDGQSMGGYVRTMIRRHLRPTQAAGTRLEDVTAA